MLSKNMSANWSRVTYDMQLQNDILCNLPGFFKGFCSVKLSFWLHSLNVYSLLCTVFE